DGVLPMSFGESMRLTADALRFCEDKNIDCSLLNADGECFHNAGATAVQEVAFSLAAGVEYVNGLLLEGVSAHQTARRIRFKYSAGTNFFMEIAKLRAARALWAKILHHFETPNDEILPMRMHVRTSWR